MNNLTIYVKVPEFVSFLHQSFLVVVGVGFGVVVFPSTGLTVSEYSVPQVKLLLILLNAVACMLLFLNALYMCVCMCVCMHVCVFVFVMYIYQLLIFVCLFRMPK